MLKTNLATRPFYNERLVHLVLAGLAAFAVVMLLAGTFRLAALWRESAALTAAAEQDERRAREIAEESASLQRQATAGDIERLERAAREANALIEQRAFSWTEFFNRIEATLPPDVMLTSLRPEIDPDLIEVSIGVVGRDVDAIDRFIGQLESTGAFAEVLSREEEITDEGEYRAVLLGRYIEGPTAVPDERQESAQGQEPSG